MFGQDLTDNGINYSTNFSPETSSYWLFPIQQSIFAAYYFPYLTNLFNPKNRLTTIKANLPVSILTGLQLNDRLIIRDKRYIINEMKTNLVSGESTFQLLNDFMPVLPARVVNTTPNVPTVVVPITFPNLQPNRGNTIRATFSSTNADVILPAPITSSQRVSFTLPDVIGNEERITEEADLRIVEDGEQRLTESFNDVIYITVTFEGEDGSEQNQDIIIIRR
jgi:hypothetical protein